MPSACLCEPTMFKSISKVQIGLPINENKKWLSVSDDQNNNLIRTLDILLLVKKKDCNCYESITICETCLKSTEKK